MLSNSAIRILQGFTICGSELSFAWSDLHPWLCLKWNLWSEDMNAVFFICNLVTSKWRRWNPVAKKGSSLTVLLNDSFTNDSVNRFCTKNSDMPLSIRLLNNNLPVSSLQRGATGSEIRAMQRPEARCHIAEHP